MGGDREREVMGRKTVCVCVDIRMYMCVLVKESEEQIKLCKF